MNGTMDRNEDEFRERHGLVPVGPDTRKLAKRHRLVLAALRDQAERSGRGTVCASVADLVRLTGLSAPGVAFARSDLLRWGLIEVAERGGGAVPPTWRVVAPEGDREFLARAGVRP